MIRDILVHPNKFLRKRSREVMTFEGLSSMVADAHDTILAMDRSGLALVQLGIPLRIVVLNGLGNRPITLVNPRILDSQGIVEATETCPSLPGRTIRVQRYEYVKVEYDRPEGSRIFETTDPMLAVALQHEIDHLNGVIMLDRDEAHHKPRVYH